jgi:triphosphoribosyl-dephospho-CoA synthase
MLASPAGLGAAPAHDVRRPATVPLVAAMAAAASRDAIARQYGSGFADVFEAGVPAFATALGRGWATPWAAVATYLAFLAALPDSHVARKHGEATAAALLREAAPWPARLAIAADPVALAPALRAWDADLKGRGLNPGTSADLAVASIFAHTLAGGLPPALGNG